MYNFTADSLLKTVLILVGIILLSDVKSHANTSFNGSGCFKNMS